MSSRQSVHLPRSAPRRRASRVSTRRIIGLAAVLCILPGVVSYGAMLTRRSNSSLGVRTVEWLRDNGARGLVNQVESWYYGLQAPSKGGPALKVLPHQAGALGFPAGARRIRPISPRHVPTATLPPNITPLIHPALPGEGVWHATFAAGGRTDPPVEITSYRPSPAYPQKVIGVAWINQARTSTYLYPGTQEPAVTLPDRGPEEVPVDKRPRLVATFNSGFKLADSNGGFAIGGHTYAPMRRGQGTILRDRSGRVDVLSWTGGAHVPAGVVYAQQNLPLIVDGGRPTANLTDPTQWGATLGNAIQVYRSAAGVDRHGNLIYIAGNYETVDQLAAIMIHVGAVRAMELDINSYWPSFITYRRPGAGHPSNLLPDMTRPATRYLTPDDRDFFAVYVK